ncbi:hypothetical protein M8494_25310 [Serratia ureilytica]
MKFELVALAPALLLMALAAAFGWRLRLAAGGSGGELAAKSRPLARAAGAAAPSLAGGAVCGGLPRFLRRRRGDERVAAGAVPPSAARAVAGRAGTGSVGRGHRSDDVGTRAHLLAPLVGAVVSPLALIAGLAC